MDLLSPTTVYTAAAVILALAVVYILSQETGLVKWVQKKNYQYEVTFSLYMLTPTEKFVFNSILFLTISMLTTACVLYLPNHVSTISRRVYYYFAGDISAGKASEAMLGAASDLAGAAYRAAVNTTAAAKEAMSQTAESLGWT